jgi:signal transduction histidine kinase
MKTEFFAGMSHDLRSPLNSVIGFTDLLLKGMEGPLTEEQTKRVGLISSEAQKLMILISDILDTSKLEAGRLEIDRKWVPSVEILTECTVESERLVGTKPIVFRSSLIPGLPPVYVDKSRLCQTLVSLVSRVIDMIEGGTITLKTSLEQNEFGGGSRLRVDLVDTSRNLEKAKRDQIRNAFSASEGILTTAKAGSLGLGMALAREVLLLHSGELRVLDPDSPESIFGIILPLEEVKEENG